MATQTTQTRISVKAEKLPARSHVKLGRYDNAGRWYPREDLYEIPGAFSIRSPSRSFPYSYLKHFYTTKFARLLLEHKPLTYMSLHRIAPQSEEGKKIIAAHAARRMQS